MRKFFAIVLAVAMVMSLAAVSFAADVANVEADVALVGPFRYDADNDELKTDLRYGSGVLYLIKIDDVTVAGTADAEDNGAFISAYKEVEKLKVKAEFEMNEKLVESVSIVKKYVAAGTYNGTVISDSNYYYFVEFKIASSTAVNEADIIGTLEFNRKADDDVNAKTNATGEIGIGKIKDCEVEVEFSVFHQKNYVSDSVKYKIDDNGDASFFKYDTTYALKFDCDDEVELEFGDGDNNGTNEGTFTVDVSGQGKVLLRYDTKANEAIVNANPGVTMHFVNFNNVKFNRVGEYVYEMEDMVAAYKVVGDKLVEIKGLDIDGDEATFYTRVLESYVFADAELVNPAAEVEAPVVEAPAEVTNPTTGAAA